MVDDEWNRALAELNQAQENAASATCLECGDWEEHLVEIECTLEEWRDDCVVNNKEEAAGALNAAYDILTTETLTPLRSNKLPKLISVVRKWVLNG